MANDEAAAPRLLHASLAVDDVDRSMAFYAAVFGTRVALDARGMTDLIRRTISLPDVSCDLAQLQFGDDGALLELIAFHDVPQGSEDAAPVRVGHGHVCLGVTDFDRVLSDAQAKGAALVGEVVMYPEGRSVYLREPGGSVLELEDVSSERGCRRE